MSVSESASATVLTVGVGEEFSTISAAIAASHNGDVIKVDAGTYTNDFATISHKITLESVGGVVNMIASEPLPNQKGILVVTNDATIQGFSFSGAEVPASEGGNGAGIRYEAGHLTLLNDDFNNNQNGLLATPLTAGTGTIDVENSEFANNGSGNGLTHNIYVGDVASFTFNESYSHDTSTGQDIKSRAEKTTITNSRIEDGSGTASYSIDLPNGGNAVIQNDVIQQGPNSPNRTIISYGEEGNLHPKSHLLVARNMIVNDLTSHAPLGVSNPKGLPVTLSANQIYGLTAAQLVSGPATVSGTTVSSNRPYLDLSSTWQTAAPGTLSPTVLGSGPDVLAIKLSEDAWHGDAEFTLSVDGVQVGGPQSTQALYALGQTQEFDVEGTFGVGTHTVSVDFLNDAWAGTPSQDRNLYVDGASIDGTPIPGSALALFTTGSQNFVFRGVPRQEVLNTSGNIVSGASGALDVVDRRGGNVISGGSAGLALNASAAPLGDQVSTAAGSTNTIILGGGASTVVSHGNDTIQAGSGSAVIQADGIVTAAGGTGNMTFIGGAGNATVSAGGGGLVVYAGSGQTNVTGGAASDQIIGGSGSLDFQAGSGSESILFGTGPTTVHDGLGIVTYGFADNSTNAVDTIFGFKVGTDHLVLHTGVTVSEQQVTGSTTMVLLSTGAHVDLIGVTGPNLFS
jgi:hypothetical protein